MHALDLLLGLVAVVLAAPASTKRSIPCCRERKLDILECPKCQGRLSIIAFITDVIVVGKILAHHTEVLKAAGITCTVYDDDGLLAAKVVGTCALAGNQVVGVGSEHVTLTDCSGDVRSLSLTINRAGPEGCCEQWDRRWRGWRSLSSDIQQC